MCYITPKLKNLRFHLLFFIFPGEIILIHRAIIYFLFIQSNLMYIHNMNYMFVKLFLHFRITGSILRFNFYLILKFMKKVFHYSTLIYIYIMWILDIFLIFNNIVSLECREFVVFRNSFKVWFNWVFNFLSLSIVFFVMLTNVT